MTPDPLNLTNARIMNPATTLNKYVYAADNPLKYIDKDGKDITIFYEPPNDVSSTGHIALAAVNQDRGTAAFLSFGPANNAGLGGLVLGTPGTFSFPVDYSSMNLGGAGTASLTIQTNPEDAQRIIDAINKMESGQAPDFTLLGTNCTTEVEAVLRDLGLDFGDTTPATYWTHLFQRYSPDMLANPFKAFSPPAQPGHEYGNPRDYGMSYRSLLFDIWMNQGTPDTSKVTTTQGGGTLCGGNTGTPCSVQ